MGGVIDIGAETLYYNGLSKRIWCWAQIPAKANHSVYRWIFNDRILTENTHIITGKNTSRYVAKFSENNQLYRLIIQNTVEADEGVYACQIEFEVDGHSYKDIKEVHVRISFYLPPLNYPQCSIEPSTNLFDSSVATFKCAVGNSNVDVTLKLSLVSNDGLVEHLAEDSAKKRKVTSQDDGAMFICELASKTFPTEHRTCSAGPITVLEHKTITKKILTQPTKPAGRQLSTETSIKNLTTEVRNFRKFSTESSITNEVTPTVKISTQPTWLSTGPINIRLTTEARSSSQTKISTESTPTTEEITTEKIPTQSEEPEWLSTVPTNIWSTAASSSSHTNLPTKPYPSTRTSQSNTSWSSLQSGTKSKRPSTEPTSIDANNSSQTKLPTEPSTWTIQSETTEKVIKTEVVSDISTTYEDNLTSKPTTTKTKARNSSRTKLSGKPSTWTSQSGTTRKIFTTEVASDIPTNYEDNSTSNPTKTKMKMNASNITTRKAIILNPVWYAWGALFLSLLIIICVVICHCIPPKKTPKAPVEPYHPQAHSFYPP